MKTSILSLIMAAMFYAQTPAAPMNVTVSQTTARCDFQNKAPVPCVRVTVTTSDPQAVAFQITLTYTRADGTTGTSGCFAGRVNNSASALFSLSDVTNIKAKVTALSPSAVVNAEPAP